MSNDPDGETATTLRLPESAGGKPGPAECPRCERWRDENRHLSALLGEAKDELATLEAGARAAAAVLSERERLRAALRPTPQNCAVVLAAWKGDDLDRRAAAVLEALALVAGIGVGP